jgi:hypothetical protein
VVRGQVECIQDQPGKNDSHFQLKGRFEYDSTSQNGAGVRHDIVMLTICLVMSDVGFAVIHGNHEVRFMTSFSSFQSQPVHNEVTHSAP